VAANLARVDRVVLLSADAQTRAWRTAAFSGWCNSARLIVAPSAPLGLIGDHRRGSAKKHFCGFAPTFMEKA